MISQNPYLLRSLQSVREVRVGRAKEQRDIGKHGFDFADAWEIFELPMLTDIDRIEVFEQRLAAIGFLREHVVVGIFVEGEDDTIRFISLRKALKHERERFEAFLRNELGED